MGETAAPLHLEFEIPGDNFAQAGKASESVRRYLKELGIIPADIRRASIAMYEGEINMVIHADGGKAVVDIFHDRAEITLIDCGKGIENIELAMTPGWSTATEGIRDLGFGAGMGLPNMKKYTDEMTVQSQVGIGTTVRMVIKFAKG